MPNDDGRRMRPTRRAVMAAAGASTLALTTGVSVARASVVANGHVFHDRSGTGVRRLGDPGVGDVLVSNGRDVVRTDADGRWRLPVADGDSLFVIKPPHWATPAGAGGVPTFSYLHQPYGSRGDVAYRHPAVAPTGELPVSIDFPLRRREESARFDVLLTADTQPQNAAELAYLRDDIITATLGCGAAFGINHGDVVFDDLSLYPRYLQILGASGIPWHHCAGNHDMNLEAPDDASSRETWKRVFGPRHYAFQHAGAAFIMLDNVHYFGHNPGTAQSGRYCGRIGVRQLQFVRNVLAHLPVDTLAVLSMHIPLVNYQDATSPADNTADRHALLQLISSRPHSVSFAGHMHATEHHYLGSEHGFAGAGPHHHHVLTAASGGWWGGPKDGRGIPSADSEDGTPNGFHVLSVDGHRYTTRYVPAAGKASAQLRAVVAGPGWRSTGASAISPEEVGGSELIVNVFDGGPQSRVSYTIGGAGGPPIAMRRVALPDPYVADLFAAHAATQKSWVRAVPSSHIWAAPLPAGLESSGHCISVEASDEYGRRLTTHLVLEIGARSRSAA